MRNNTFSTIQGAVDSASAGDVIVLLAGDYYGSGNINVSLAGKRIKITSEYGTPNSVIIDCQSTINYAFLASSGYSFLEI